MAAHRHETTRRIESTEFPGVNIILKKMTEGRRLELRKLISDPNRRVREIFNEQAVVEEAAKSDQNDKAASAKWMELQDEFDGLMLEKINPAWVTWGVKQIEGLEVDGKTLGVEDWKDWPSALFSEVLNLVKSEAELNGSERKNFESPTTSGEPEGGTQKSSSVNTAENTGGGEIETVVSITREP